MALALTTAVGGFVWLYPNILEAVVSRWSENTARRATWLARQGRLDEAEEALARAAARKKVWIEPVDRGANGGRARRAPFSQPAIPSSDSSAGRVFQPATSSEAVAGSGGLENPPSVAAGIERQQVYLGRHVLIDHADFVEAAEAFIAAQRPEAARRAAWEAIWRYHAVNRSGEIPAPWRALAAASRALGDAATAQQADSIARFWSPAAVGESGAAEPPLPIADSRSPIAKPAPNDKMRESGLETRQSGAPVPPAAFRVVRDGRFNPANEFQATSTSLFFDRPCVAAADAPMASEMTMADGDGNAIGAGVVVLRFEARSQPAYDWPAIFVAQWAGQTRFRVIDSRDWAGYEIAFDAAAADARRRPLELRVAYLNHGAEETATGARRRTLELRGLTLSTSSLRTDDQDREREHERQE